MKKNPFYNYMFVIILVDCFISLLFPSPTRAQTRGEVSDEFQGEGTAQNPYLITSAADLRLLSDRSVSGDTFEGEYFKMTEDIVINENVLMEDGEVNKADSSKFEEWQSIKSFRGFFDGQRHSISGLFVNGLFSSISNGTVCRLVIKDAYLTSPALTSSLSDSKIYEIISYATVELEANMESNRGGICGYVGTSSKSKGTSTSVFRCANLGKKCNGGGIMGMLQCSAENDVIYIRDCYNRADGCYAGIATYAYSNSYQKVYLQNCINYGSAQYAGIIHELYYSTIQNCINIGKISEGYAIGKFIREMTKYEKNYYLETSASSGQNSMTERQMKSTDFLTTLNNNAKDISRSDQWVKGDDGYPTFAWIQKFHSPRGWLDETAKVETSTKLQGDGSEENPYLINSVADLRRLAENCAGGKTYREDYVRLTHDLVFYHNVLKDGELNGYTYDYEQTPVINGFYGTFDGGGHSINGLFYNMEYNALFMNLYGTVTNLSVKDSYVHSGIAGILESSDDNKYHATISNCSFNGYATEAGIAGVIQGQNISIQDCINYGNSEKAGIAGWSQNSKVTLRINRCLNCGNVKYGILGEAWGKVLISDCMNVGLTLDAGIIGMGGSKKYSNMEIKNCVNAGDGNGVGIACEDVGILKIDNVVNVASKSMWAGIIKNVQNETTISNAYYLETAASEAYYYKYLGSTLVQKNIHRMTEREMKKQSFLDELNQNAAALGNDYSLWKFGSDGFPTLDWVTDELLDEITDVNITNKLRITSANRGVYNLAGHRITSPARGVNIIRMSDGTTKKVFIK